MRAALLLLIPSLSLAAPGDVSIQTWPGDAPAAASVTGDDGYSAYWRLLGPLLEDHGLAGSFFIVTDWVDAEDLWHKWEDVADGGHEVGSHSSDHHPWDELSAEQADAMLAESRALLIDRLGYDHARSFAHPSAPDEADSAAVAAAGFSAARASGGVEDATPADPFAVRSQTIGADTDPLAVAGWLDELETTGGWLVLRSHGVADPEDPRNSNHEGSDPLPLAAAEQIVADLASRPVWVERFGEVAAYARTRDAASIEDAALGDALTFHLAGSPDAGLHVAVELPPEWTEVDVTVGIAAPVRLTAAAASELVLYAPVDVVIAPPSADPPPPPGPGVGTPPPAVGCSVSPGAAGLLPLLLLGLRRRRRTRLPPALLLGLLLGCGAPPADLSDLPVVPEFSDGGACVVAAQCNEHDGCVDGACGACSTDDQCRPGDSCEQGFCMAPLAEWNLTLDPADLELIQQTENILTEIWIPATVQADGVDYGEVQIRLRGGSSRVFPKASLRVEFPEGADHPGYARKVNLRAEYNDYSYVRTHVAYETFRRLTELPTPRHRYVHVSVNGAFYGLMTEVERIGPAFLTRNGRNPTASTYEDVRPSIAASLVPMADEAAYRERYPKATGDDDYGDLVDFIERDLWTGFNPAVPEDVDTSGLRDAVHLDDYIEYLAVMALIQSHDHVAKNFYVSRQRKPGTDDIAWEFYPWDVDLTMGCLWDPIADDVLCDSLVVDAPWDLGVIRAWDAEGCFCNMAIHQTMSDAELHGRFAARVCELTVDPWWTERVPALIDVLGTVLAPHVDADPNDSLQSLGGWHAYRREVVDFAQLRAAFLRESFACAN